MNARAVSLVLVAALAAGCGKKGPPLAPLHLVPNAITSLDARRTADTVHLRFVLPTSNLNGPGPVALDRIEVYAVTVAPGAATPANRDLLTATYRVGTIAVKPAPVEGEPVAANAADDKRPAPGEPVEFTETLTPDKLEPAKLPLAPAPPAPVPAATNPAPGAAVPPTAPPGTTVPPTSVPGTTVPPTSAPAAPGAAAPAPAVLPVAPLPTYASRVYVVRGLTRSGRGGQPSARLQVPLVQPPAPPAGLKASFTETAVSLAWTAPAAAPEGTPIGFNVSSVGGASPLNPAPLTAPAFERAGAEIGKEQCFVVRSVVVMGTLPIESESSEPACVTPKDIFPPAAPQRLQVVPAPGVMNLSWQPNTEADLAGYIVLRGDAPGDTLQALTPEPITATRFEDQTARPGARYVYAVVAVDRATPRNTSAFSNRVEETAR